MTTQAQIYNATVIAKGIEHEISKIIPANAHVDDWSDYGSFRVFITLGASSSFADFHLRKIGNIIRKEIKHSCYFAELEILELPKRTYVRDGYRKYFNGYNGNRIMLDFRVF